MNKLFLKMIEETAKTNAVKQLHWCRSPGRFVNKLTGALVPHGVFTGTVREWYETLVETIVDAANMAEMNDVGVIVSKDVLTILESTVLYQPQLLYSKDGDVLRSPTGAVLEHEILKGTLRYNDYLVFLSDTAERNKIVVFDVNNRTATIEIQNMDVI